MQTFIKYISCVQTEKKMTERLKAAHVVQLQGSGDSA